MERVEKLLKPFGKYFLLDRIAQGGMADIFRGRPRAADSGNRVLAIKCLRANLAAQERFMEMFRSEIKITLALKHPNIVHHYDFGDGKSATLDGEVRPYLAMEYVHGRSFRQLLAVLRKQDLRPKLEVVVHVVNQVARGLHYAHEFRDPISQLPLFIIHRDVNPANILLSFGGDVKLIDFGVAKAAVMGGEATETGLIKGTPSYLSPEQVLAQGSLDHRSDIFTLGIVLWEGLTGKRLFKAQDDREMLLMIERCASTVKPPSSVVPEISKELDAVVMKALEHDVGRRFETMEEFRVALLEAAREAGKDETLISAGNSLQEYLKTYFGSEERSELREIQQLNEEAEALLRVSSVKRDGGPRGWSPPPRPDAGGGPLSSASEFLMPKGEAAQTFVLDDSAAKLLKPRRREQDTWVGRMRREIGSSAGKAAPLLSRIIRTIILLAIAGVVSALAYWNFDALKPLGTKAWNSVVQRAHPPTAGGPAANPSPAAAGASSPGPEELRLILRVIPPGKGTVLALSGRVVADGEDELIVDAPRVGSVLLLVFRPGFEKWVKPVSLERLSQEAGAASSLQLDVRLTPIHFGLLTVSTVVNAEAEMVMAGKRWSLKTPIENEKIPPGSYELILRNRLLGIEKKIPIEVREGRSVRISEDMSRRN